MKKGTGSVFVTVLLILIGIVSVALLWSFFQIFIIKSGEEIEIISSAGTLEVASGSVYVDSSNSYIRFGVRRAVELEMGYFP